MSTLPDAFSAEWVLRRHRSGRNGQLARRNSQATISHETQPHELASAETGVEPSQPESATSGHAALCDTELLLDETFRLLSRGYVGDAQLVQIMDELVTALGDRRRQLDTASWQEFIARSRQHPLCKLLHEDPFTFRAYSKPRGYAGDAELLDYIYGREEMWTPPRATQLGLRIFHYTTRAPAPEGVLARRGFIARTIDELAETVKRPDVLSVAAGHLREASLCAAIKRRKLGRYVALDSDLSSLREMQRCYGQFGIEPVGASIRQMLANRVQLGQFDLIYSLGLFDYLTEATARRLMWTMFQSLRPGGLLLVANFLPEIRDAGYMEVYMDWNLVYRTRQQMVDVTMEIPQAEIRDIVIFAEDNQNIIFLAVVKG